MLDLNNLVIQIVDRMGWTARHTGLDWQRQRCYERLKQSRPLKCTFRLTRQSEYSYGALSMMSIKLRYFTCTTMRPIQQEILTCVFMKFPSFGPARSIAGHLASCLWEPHSYWPVQYSTRIKVHTKRSVLVKDEQEKLAEQSKGEAKNIEVTEWQVCVMITFIVRCLCGALLKLRIGDAKPYPNEDDPCYNDIKNQHYQTYKSEFSHSDGTHWNVYKLRG